MFACGIGCDEKRGDLVHGDPGGYAQFVWINESDHIITMSMDEWSGVENEVLPIGGKVMRDAWGGIMSIPNVKEFTRGGISILFDEGPYGVVFDYFGYGNISNSSNLPIVTRKDAYLQLDESYRFEMLDAREVLGEEYSDWPAGQWTYTFTNADYEAAVKMGEARGESCLRPTSAKPSVEEKARSAASPCPSLH